MNRIDALRKHVPCSLAECSTDLTHCAACGAPWPCSYLRNATPENTDPENKPPTATGDRSTS